MTLAYFGLRIAYCPRVTVLFGALVRVVEYKKVVFVIVFDFDFLETSDLLRRLCLREGFARWSTS